MTKCEICGDDVRVFPGFGSTETMAVLCNRCISESRSIDGTLKAALEKVRENRTKTKQTTF